MVDSLQAARADSGLVPSPLPDPIVHVVQWIFQRPGWVMIAGIVIGVVVAIMVLRLLWKHRQDIWTWLTTRSRGTKIAMASTVGVFLVAALGLAYTANDYMEHNNNFCRGCHVFVPAGQPFVRPDTGTYLIVNMLQGKHDTLECHQCHLPDKIAQAQELVLWMVDRPDKVPAHEKVPPTVCKSCHEQGDAKKTWQEITSTAGHRVHFESDSLRDKNIECLTCHARSAHRFVPADSTCAQSGCHLSRRRHNPPGQHGGPVGSGSTARSAMRSPPRSRSSPRSIPPAGTLRPGEKQCFSCHQMKLRLSDFDPRARSTQGPVRDVPQSARKRQAGRRAEVLCHQRLSLRLGRASSSTPARSTGRPSSIARPATLHMRRGSTPAIAPVATNGCADRSPDGRVRKASVAVRHHQGAPVGVGAARPDRPPREGRRAAG